MPAIIVAVLTAGVGHGQIQVPVDPTSSAIDVELCAQGVCDTDSSPITGEVTIEVDSRDHPAQITLDDFDLEASEVLDFHLDYGFLGEIFATATGVGVQHADPGPHHAFVPVVGGAFAFMNVPFLARGIAEYEAVGSICTILMSSGMPCINSIDLADSPNGTFDSASGTIEVVDHVLYLSTTLTSSAPFDPDNPSLGMLTQTATLNGRTVLPQPADNDGDGDVDPDDLAAFAACVTGPELPYDLASLPPGCTAVPDAEGIIAFDFDRDRDVDHSDFAVVQRCHSGDGNLGELDCAG